MILKNNKAFTLIEMLIVVALIGILAMIAIPSYESYVQKSRRADALGVLQAMQLSEEKFRANNVTYGDLTDVWGGLTTTTGGAL